MRGPHEDGGEDDSAENMSKTTPVTGRRGPPSAGAVRDRVGDTVAVMAKHVRRWCLVGGLALGCAWLSAVEALPVLPEPATARTAAEYRGRPAGGAPRDAVSSRRETGPAGGQPGASTAPPSNVEPSDEGSSAVPPGSAAASRWMLRWTVWLQDYLLTWGFLV